MKRIEDEKDRGRKGLRTQRIKDAKIEDAKDICLNTVEGHREMVCSYDAKDEVFAFMPISKHCGDRSFRPTPSTGIYIVHK